MRPRIGVSRCLLGEQVRYDGGHKRDALLLGVLEPYVEWVPVCPEVEIGMGTPREAIRLVADAHGVPSGPQRVRLVGVGSGRDWSELMGRWSAERARALADENLSGYILKKDSPSCGLERVRVHTAMPSGGPAARNGRGLFAEALIRQLPNLPIEDEGRLRDERLRDNFLERVFAYARIRRLFAPRWTIGALVRFHTQHKLQLLAHGRSGYTEVGRLVAGAADIDRPTLAADYEATFMRTLRTPATRGRHGDVMLHAMGHLKRLLDSADRDELLNAIEEHRRGVIPLVVPLTLLRHHARRRAVAYLSDQSYLYPEHAELALRFHA